MAYHIGNGVWNGIFAVPNIVADQHLKMASGLSVKVLLLLLRKNGEISIEEIAGALCYNTEDIQDALNYWIALGVINTAEEKKDAQLIVYEPAQSFSPPPIPPCEAALKPAAREDGEERKVTTVGLTRPRLNTQEINELAGQDDMVTYLLQESQSVLGKPLSPVVSSTIISLYSYAGLQPDLILMLLHYCVSIGKDKMRYIERMAGDWVERGIDSHEKAEAEILRLTQAGQIENKIKSAFGIYDRSLVPSEKKYIKSWTEELGVDIILIKLAFERSVEIKGKLSFPYINGILVNWHKKGVTTAAQAMEEIKSGKTAKPEEKRQSASYDIGELEKMIAYGDIV